MKRVLIADTLPDVCVQLLSDTGLEVDYRPGMTPEELKEASRTASGIVCRSGAKITADVLATAECLEAITRAGVGVNNIDVSAASLKGVVVMNTPGGNTTSTAEHAFALMIALARNIGPAYVGMREGRWDKKKCIGSQLAGATLGVVGLGRIGQTIAKRAVAFGMNVIGMDPYVNREAAERHKVALVENIEQMLPDCDYLTLHVPQTESTTGLIDAESIALMKPTACIINCARGAVVDQDAVVAAVKDGRLGGAAFDVYTKEPVDDYSFAQHDRILATPHLGASTDQAQLAVATQAAEQMVEALLHNNFVNALNIPAVAPEEKVTLEPFCRLAERLGRLAAAINDGRPESILVSCRGELTHCDVRPVQTHGALGIMRSMLGNDVNIVSAPHIAEERGISVTSSSSEGTLTGFTDSVEIQYVTDTGTLSIAGTVFSHEHLRITNIDGFELELAPEGEMLFVFSKDMPGLIGQVGSILGTAGINVARMAFGRIPESGDAERALLALNLDCPCTPEAIESIAALEVVEDVVTLAL